MEKEQLYQLLVRALERVPRKAPAARLISRHELWVLSACLHLWARGGPARNADEQVLLELGREAAQKLLLGEFALRAYGDVAAEPPVLVLKALSDEAILSLFGDRTMGLFHQADEIVSRRWPEPADPSFQRGGPGGRPGAGSSDPADDAGPSSPPGSPRPAILPGPSGPGTGRPNKALYIGVPAGVVLLGFTFLLWRMRDRRQQRQISDLREVLEYRSGPEQEPQPPQARPPAAPGESHEGAG